MEAERERLNSNSYDGVYAPLRYDKKTVRGLSIAQMVVGGLWFVQQIAQLAIIGNVKVFLVQPHGIWTGTLFFVAGVLGLLSVHKHPDKYLITSSMVMSIVASSVCALTFGFAVLEASTVSIYGFSRVTSLPFAILKALLSVGYAGCSIASSSFGCKALCCGKNQDSAVTCFIDNKQPIRV